MTIVCRIAALACLAALVAAGSGCSSSKPDADAAPAGMKAAAPMNAQQLADYQAHRAMIMAAKGKGP